jgi:hypothetical protein
MITANLKTIGERIEGMLKSQSNLTSYQFPLGLFKGRQGLASGCLIAIIVTLAIFIGAGIYIASNFKHWAAEGVTLAMTVLIEESALPDEDKSEIIDILDQLKEDFQSDDISLEELGLILEAIPGSPALPIGMVIQFEASYVKLSGLSDAEKTEANLTLNRFAQGLSGGTISWEEAHDVSGPLTDVDMDGKETLKEPGEITDDEIREVLAAAKQAADNAAIPEVKIEIDISDEFRKAIEEAIGRTLW